MAINDYNQSDVNFVRIIRKAASGAYWHLSVSSRLSDMAIIDKLEAALEGVPSASVSETPIVERCLECKTEMVYRSKGFWRCPNEKCSTIAQTGPKPFTNELRPDVGDIVEVTMGHRKGGAGTIMSRIPDDAGTEWFHVRLCGEENAMPYLPSELRVAQKAKRPRTSDPRVISCNRPYTGTGARSKRCERRLHHGGKCGPVEECPKEAEPLHGRDTWQRLEKLAEETLEVGERLKSAQRTNEASHASIGSGAGDDEGYIHPDVLASQSKEFQAEYELRGTRFAKSSGKKLGEGSTDDGPRLCDACGRDLDRESKAASDNAATARTDSARCKGGCGRKSHPNNDAWCGAPACNIRPRPEPPLPATDDTQLAMRHVAAHERQFINQGWIDDTKALLAEVRADERKRLCAETTLPKGVVDLLQELAGFFGVGDTDIDKGYVKLITEALATGSGDT